MGDRPHSPRRRHILASINPDVPRDRTRQRQDDDVEPGEGDASANKSSRRSASPSVEIKEYDVDPDTTQPRRSRLRLKDHTSKRRHRSSRERDGDRDHDDSHGRSHRRRHHHRHRRRHRSPTPTNPHNEEALDPEAAFRESLFDAMADDEGAAYWEGVYGQPVHIYPTEKAGPTGELERMTDEEYSAYVRQKMWEKTHAGLLEERARREEARKRKAAEARQSRKLHEDMERSIQRGEERRRRKRWAARWDEYSRAWAAWDGTPATIAWPVDSGQRDDVGEEAVRAFFVHGLKSSEDEAGEKEKDFVTSLREERVRWHPDKMQQRLGGQVDEATMRDVTAIFQIIDRLWADARPSA